MHKHGSKLRSGRATELADRAGTLFRLGFTQAQATARLTASRGSSIHRRSTVRKTPTDCRRGGREDRRRYVRPPSADGEPAHRRARAVAACAASGAPTRPLRRETLSISSAAGAGCITSRSKARRASRFASAGACAPIRPVQLVGRYVRRRVRSRARRSSAANARGTGSALFDVTVALAPGNTGSVVVKETSCATGRRRAIASATSIIPARSPAIAWHCAGVPAQTLWPIDSALAPLPDAVAPELRADRHVAVGRTSYDDDGNLRDEGEWWSIARRTDTRFDATALRRVTVRPTGAVIRARMRQVEASTTATCSTARRKGALALTSSRSSPASSVSARHAEVRSTKPPASRSATSHPRWRGKRHQISTGPTRHGGDRVVLDHPVLEKRQRDIVMLARMIDNHRVPPRTGSVAIEHVVEQLAVARVDLATATSSYGSSVGSAVPIRQ